MTADSFGHAHSNSTVEEKKKRIVAGFFRHGVAQVNAREPFRLASGALSPVYLDHRKIFSIPGLRDDVAALWAGVVVKALGVPLFPSDTVIAGTATAGIAPAFALASHLSARFAYVRTKPKSHGLGRMVEGVWAGGEACVVVDDMVTTGGSLLEAASRLREESGRLLLATSITRHDFPATAARFESAGLTLASCFTSRELFSLAADGGMLSDAELGAVFAWLGEQARRV